MLTGEGKELLRIEDNILMLDDYLPILCIIKNADKKALIENRVFDDVVDKGTIAEWIRAINMVIKEYNRSK